KELQHFDGEKGQNPTDIFVCGEVLNVDGDCGGFNLHFAFASGIIAGRNAARRAKKLC
ncbi:MAG: NAD(P)/FAD-dependent oxidoreductase, partial [Lachnospiraceae bacterium]|nr:NAD(P)/FAD-dependent oxidoreductase [Lachnospiraceae bacterium]